MRLSGESPEKGPFWTRGKFALIGGLALFLGTGGTFIWGLDTDQYEGQVVSVHQSGARVEFVDGDGKPQTIDLQITEEGFSAPVQEGDVVEVHHLNFKGYTGAELPNGDVLVPAMALRKNPQFC